MTLPSYKVAGGAYTGFTAGSWPLYTLEVSQGSLILWAEKFFWWPKKKVYELTHKNVIKVEPVRYFPFIAWGIRIRQTYDKDGFDNYYFWVWDLKKLEVALKEFGWL